MAPTDMLIKITFHFDLQDLPNKFGLISCNVQFEKSNIFSSWYLTESEIRKALIDDLSEWPLSSDGVCLSGGLVEKSGDTDIRMRLHFAPAKSARYVNVQIELSSKDLIEYSFILKFDTDYSEISLFTSQIQSMLSEQSSDATLYSRRA